MRRDRVVGAVVLLTLVGAAVWAWGGADDRTAAAARAGAAALSRAVGGERAAFSEARQHFAEARGVAVLDPYPMFAFEVVLRVERGELGETSDALRPTLSHLAAGELDDAQRTLETVRGGGRTVPLLRRLLEEMQAARK